MGAAAWRRVDARPRRRRPPAIGRVAVGAGALAAAGVVLATQLPSAAPLRRRASERLALSGAHRSAGVVEQRDARARFDSVTAGVRARHPLPGCRARWTSIHGTSAPSSRPGCRTRPRPVFQSFSAYTPTLAALNAEHLRSPRAADNVLFDIESIDGRLPAMDDGRSWAPLWARYALVADTGGFLWLRRRPTPLAEPAPRLLATARTRLGDPITLPHVACGAVWMQADCGPPSPTAWPRCSGRGRPS
jgi:hypothetical protein